MTFGPARPASREWRKRGARYQLPHRAIRRRGGGPSFTGESSTLLSYVAYSDSNFALANRVTSFRLFIPARNVFEWLFGSEPVESGATTPAGPRAGLRSVTGSEFPGADPAKQYLSITATVRKSTPGWTLIAQAASSPDLLDEPGSSDHIVSILLNDLGEFEEREWFHTLPIGHGDAGFMRLKLTGE
jgi:hypothetical protein